MARQRKNPGAHKNVRVDLDKLLIPLDVAHHSGMISPTVPI